MLPLIIVTVRILFCRVLQFLRKHQTVNLKVLEHCDHIHHKDCCFFIYVYYYVNSGDEPLRNWMACESLFINAFLNIMNNHYYLKLSATHVESFHKTGFDHFTFHKETPHFVLSFGCELHSAVYILNDFVCFIYISSRPFSMTTFTCRDVCVYLLCLAFYYGC